MANININLAIALIFTLSIATHLNATTQSDDQICLMRQKLAKVHFYAHDIAGGPNSTVFEIARAAVSGATLFSFGKVQVFDGVMTVGPTRNTTRLGKVQGIVTSADMNTTAMAMNFNAVFTSGEFNGSTVSVAGRNELNLPRRVVSVVGGTGAFRFTRGYIVVTTYNTSVSEDNAFRVTFEYTLYATYCP